MKVASLTDIHNVVSRLLYSSPAMELDFYPTFEVQKSIWDNIQEEVKVISQQTIPPIPFENKNAKLSFNIMGVKCIVIPEQ